MPRALLNREEGARQRSLWHNPGWFATVRYDGPDRVLLCGGCSAEVRGTEAWAEHWARDHGTIEEARAHLALRARRSARTQELAKANREHRRTVDRRKLSALPGARIARALRAWWRENWPNCSQCGSRIVVAEIAGRSISFCPAHGFAWTWEEESLFWTAAPSSARTWERRRRNGTVTSGALKAWATRRARGRVSQDMRRAWAVRRKRFGSAGLSVDALTRVRAGARSRAIQRWRNPTYRERQIERIRSGIARQKAGTVGEAEP